MLVRIAPDIDAALARRGQAARCAQLLAPANPQKRSRCAWRVELEDGQTLKLRRLENEAAARALCRLREGLESAFAPVLARDGALLFERWIDGTPLDPAQPGRVAAEAGALLGRLHARAHHARPAEVATAPWLTRAEQALAVIAEAKLLGHDEVTLLARTLRAQDPGSAPLGLLHRDFCGENMVIDGAGRLCVIDNEWFEIGPTGLDLGRSLSRWPLDPESRQRFVHAYLGAAARDPGPLPFWWTVAAVWSVELRQRIDPARIQAPLSGLQQLAADLLEGRCP